MAARIGPGRRLIVLGGGLSGLSYTHYLRNFSAYYNKADRISKITLLEANDYMGGSIKTQVHDDGLVHELGPRTIRYFGLKGNNTGALLEQLGLADKVVSVKKTSEAGRNRLIYRNGKMYKAPGSILDLFKKLPGDDTRLYKAILKDRRTPKMDLTQYEYEDPPLYDFVSYRAGTAVSESLVDPLLRGIVAGDVRKLSTRSFFEEYLEAEQRYGSLWSAMRNPPVIKHRHDELFPNEILGSKLLDEFKKEKVTSYTIQGGLQTIPEYLSNSLLNTNEDGVISIYNKTRVISIRFNTEDPEKAPCSVVVRTVDGDMIEIDGDHIVATIGSKDLAEILPTPTTEEQRSAYHYIQEIDHSPVACVGLEFRNLDRLPSFTNSFGFLTHSKSGSKILGISFDTMFNPEIDKPTKSFRMTCMLGGSWFHDVFGTSDPTKVKVAQMEQIALAEVAKIMGITEDPYRTCPYMWKNGIAQYKPGHKKRLQDTREAIKKLNLPLTLLGQSYDGVSVNDVIFSARMAADELVAEL